MLLLKPLFDIIGTTGIFVISLAVPCGVLGRAADAYVFKNEGVKYGRDKTIARANNPTD